MPRALRLAGLAALAAAAALLLALRVLGLEPRDQRPGLWLAGPVADAPVADWSFTDAHEEIQIQTRGPLGVPHSVTAYCAALDGALYLFSAYYGGGEFPDARRWNRNVMRDPRVRIRIGGILYERTLRHVTDEAAREGVHRALLAKYPGWESPGLADVHVFRVEP